MRSRGSNGSLRRRGDGDLSNAELPILTTVEHEPSDLLRPPAQFRDIPGLLRSRHNFDDLCRRCPVGMVVAP